MMFTWTHLEKRYIYPSTSRVELCVLEHVQNRWDVLRHIWINKVTQNKCRPQAPIKSTHALAVKINTCKINNQRF